MSATTPARHPHRLGRIGRQLSLCVTAVALSVAFLPGAQAQFPDLSKALGQLPQLLRPGSASKPADAVTSSKGADLIRLLSQSLEEIDLPREREIGRQLSSVLLGSKPLHPDMTLQRYVNQLGRWISLQSTRPDLPWTFAVLDDAGYNAFAAPGGYIFVTKGLVDRSRDESELAAILAHEITHVTEKHHLKAMKSRASSGIASQLGAQWLSAQVRNSTVSGAISDQGLSLVRDLYSRGLDRDDEFEADRAGVALAARAGFDPYGLVSVLQSLRTTSPDNPLFALTLSTHPPAQLRLDQLESAMGKRLDHLVTGESVTIAQRLQRLGTAAPTGR